MDKYELAVLLYSTKSTFCGPTHLLVIVNCFSCGIYTYNDSGHIIVCTEYINTIRCFLMYMTLVKISGLKFKSNAFFNKFEIKSILCLLAI